VQADAEAPQSAAGNTDIVIPGEVAIGSGSALDQGMLYLRTSRLSSTGDYFAQWNAVAEPEVGAIRSAKLANGTVCGARVDPISGKATPNEFVCPLNGAAAGSRIGFELVANFPTTRRDLGVTVGGTVVTPAFVAAGSQPSFTKWITLNPERTVDLVTEASSQAVIGRDRDARVMVKVTNKGATTAENVTIAGDARGGIGGRFQGDTLKSDCTGVNKPIYTRCSVGNIAPGATATFMVDVHAANKMGLFAVTFGASHANYAAIETNPDDNATTLAFTVVKANMVPFKGVKQTKPAKTNLMLLAKRGTKATLVCPSGCKAVVQLRVRRPLAEKLGLAKPIKNAKAAKRALPYIVIGQATKARGSKGKVIVNVRLSGKYRMKVQKLTRPLSIMRVATVTSTEKGTRGATFSGTKSMTVKPLKRPRR
jgi:hypothetical protein